MSWYKLQGRLGKQCFIANYSKLNNFAELKPTERETSNTELDKMDKNSLEIPSTKSSQDSPLTDLEKFNMKLKTPVNLFKFENTATVSNLIDSVNINRNERILSGLSCSNNESDDSFLTDLVGNRFRFMLN